MEIEIFKLITEKLSANWLVFFIIFFFVFKELKKGYKCLYEVWEKSQAKQLQKEQRYYDLIKKNEKIIEKNTEAFEKLSVIINNKLKDD